MNRNGQLIKYRGYLKYLEQKLLTALDLIEKYIRRIDENTSLIKDESTASEEERRNVDLLTEVEKLIDELDGNRKVDL